jgi:hypothetical protein
MTANKDKQLEGAKKRARLAPAAKKVKPRAKERGGSTRGVSAAKAARVSSKPSQKKIAADERPGNERSQTGTTERAEENPQDVTASGAGATNENEVIEKAPGNCDDGVGKSSGAKSTNGGVDPVKPLTEAGKKRLVNKLLGLAETQATQGGFKITPADLIRLMQLHKEMTPQRDRKVTVQWIEDKPE